MQWTDFPIFDSLNFPSEFDATDTLAGILLVNKPLGWTSFDDFLVAHVQTASSG